MKVSKGLGFPVVALASAGHMPAKGEDQQEAARLFYVAATRATQKLVIGVGGEAEFWERLQKCEKSPDLASVNVEASCICWLAYTRSYSLLR